MIKSILDTDLYKFSQQWFVLQHYPNAVVEYQFNNRNTEMKFNNTALNIIRSKIDAMTYVLLTNAEYDWMAKKLPFLPKVYLEYLKSYRFNPKQIVINLDIQNNLVLSIHGPWHETILWEVPLMAIISEVYFKIIDTDWSDEIWKLDQYTLAQNKALKLSAIANKFTDFGTRRRRSYETQDIVIKAFKDSNIKNFFGTSNVHFANKYNIHCVGTAAHELTQGISALEGLRYANRYTLKMWQDTYKGDLGYALTDTFGTEAFFKDFNKQFARLYDGTRHDSACPFLFTDKMIKHYQIMGIDPNSKTIIFSDGLNVDTAIAISKYCHAKIGAMFGIGTHFTNSFKNSKPLNIVIKLQQVNNIPVVKLSDTLGKEIGDTEAIRVAKWTFFKSPL